MRCGQTEKFIGEINQSVGKPTKRKVGDWNLAGTKAKRLKSDSQRVNEKLRRKQARLIKQYRDIFFPIFRKARPSFFRVLQRMTLVLNVTNLKYGKYDMTSKKKNNNKRLIDRAK